MEGESLEDPNAGETPQDLAVPPQPEELEKHAAGGDEEKKWPGWPGVNVFRMLFPAVKAGRIIGHKGNIIKKISDESKASIKIFDGRSTCSESVVMVSAKEEPDALIPPAIDGLLRTHRLLINLDSDSTPATSGPGGKVITQLLVGHDQAGRLVGWKGSTINSIENASNCTIKVLKEHLPVLSLKDDTVVKIRGEPTCVHTALELIAGHLRKFLVDRNIVRVFEMEMRMANVRANQNLLMPQSWGHLHGFPINADDEAYVGFNPQSSQIFTAEAANSVQRPSGGSISGKCNPFSASAPFNASASSDAGGHVSQAPAKSRDHGYFSPWH